MISRTQDGEIVFHAIDDRDELKSAFKEMFSTDIGKLYKKEYFTPSAVEEHEVRLVAAAQQIAGGPRISSRHLVHALTLLVDSGELQPRVAVQTAQLAEPEEDLRPRKNGKLLTPEQIAWGEMSRFATEATSDQIRQRKNTDHKFREFIQTNLRREMDQPVDGAVTPAGEPEKKLKASAELVDFVHKYNRTPSDALKPRGGYVHLDGQQPMPYSTFISLVERAAQARLL
jgi:hypothetical protein